MIDAQFSRTLSWQKASASLPGGNCVELAHLDGGVALRDSKFPEAGAFYYTAAEFGAFLDGCRRGEFDHFVAE